MDLLTHQRRKKLHLCSSGPLPNPRVMMSSPPRGLLRASTERRTGHAETKTVLLRGTQNVRTRTFPPVTSANAQFQTELGSLINCHNDSNKSRRNFNPCRRLVVDGNWESYGKDNTRTHWPDSTPLTRTRARFLLLFLLLLLPMPNPDADEANK